MVALLGALLGFLTSVFPDVLKFLNGKRDRAHELAILDRQLSADALGHERRLREIRIEAEGHEQVALYAHAKPSKVRWIEGLGSSVRPVLTYSFFFLYAAVKVAQFLLLKSYSPSIANALLRMWSESDEALFSAVMSFWFGHRALRQKTP